MLTRSLLQRVELKTQRPLAEYEAVAHLAQGVSAGLHGFFSSFVQVVDQSTGGAIMDGDGLMSQSDESYPAELEVEYPDRELNWKTTFFRIFLVTPIGIILGLLSGPVVSHQSGDAVFAVGGIVVFPTMLMLLFRQKYPRWWFDWNLELTRFSMRVAAYLALLRDEYPSTDNEQAVHVWVPYPDAKELSRWLPLLKWFLAVPHYIVLCFLGVAAVVAVILAWFAILLTGRYPPGLFNFVVGVLRYGLRINAYAFLLVTDQYPPFRLG